MSSAISRIVIKSDPLSMQTPQPGQTVAVAGESGLYVVMEVDRSKRRVQLMEKTGRHRLSEVSFASIRKINRKLTEAIHRLLDLQSESLRQPG